MSAITIQKRMTCRKSNAFRPGSPHKYRTVNETALIHNDYKYDNVVLDPCDATKIVGVRDWGNGTLGDPLSDLGTALAYWTDLQDSGELQEIRSAPTTLPGTLTRAQLVGRYAVATGRDPGDMVFY